MDHKFKKLFLEKINKEIRKRTQKRKSFDKTLLKEWKIKSKQILLKNKFETKKINSTLNFCKELNHKHANKIDKGYFSHLLRLGCMSLFLKKI
jgi:2-oxoglutarate dehydrogenase complex dehydrogenase (E1) component-like enzyme